MDLPPLPVHPEGVPWPTKAWPHGNLSPKADRGRLEKSLDHALANPSPTDIGETHALLIIQGGRLVLERYAAGFGPEVTCRSWSMAKSITQALTGLLVGDGLLDIHAPADVPQWHAWGDPRAAITLDQLLRMSSGLSFVEDYAPDHPSDVIEMLYGKGREDMAAFAAGFPLAHQPGEHFAYSSGTTNIAAACLGRALGANGRDFEAFMRERLFDPIGATSADPKFDDAGTFIGSSFCFATPRDFARFGLLYMRDGVWDGTRLLPAGWVDYARTPTFQQAGCADGPYGASWWLDMAGPGSFSANGYQGQHIILCPDRDLIIVRHGATPEVAQPTLKTWLADLATLFN
jgi:CubicO group peptidase (beta-lactamase class C family)